MCDIEISKILQEHFGLKPAREIKPTDIERFQDKMLKTLSKEEDPLQTCDGQSIRDADKEGL